MIRILSATLLALTAVSFAVDSASANCRPGSPNCVTAGSNRPKFCNPCKIDSGLGSQCKNTNTCGIKK
jgi:hypothetical protein